MNANERIQAARKFWDRWVIRRIRRDGSFNPLNGVGSPCILNALERAEAAGRIIYDAALHGYVMVAKTRKG